MFQIATVIVLTLTSICGGQRKLPVWFEKDGVCVAAAPCICSDRSIICDGFELRAMPTFIPLDVSNHALAGGPMYDTANFLMSNNNIESIEDRAFCNLTFALSTRVYMMLTSNAISSLADNAFDCLQNNLHRLDLQNNRLTYLPLAMLKLRTLKRLFLQNNPLVHLHPLVMRHLGPTLTTLLLDLGLFSTWPSSFSHLSVLSTLGANNITFPSIPENGFSGFNATLTFLRFTNSRLTSLPRSFCQMPLLQDARVQVFEPMNLTNTLSCVKKVESTINESNGLLEYMYIIPTRNSTKSN